MRARRAVAQGIDAAGIVRRTLGRHAIPANGLIPPGLLGYVPTPRSRPQASGQVSGAHSVAREAVEHDGRCKPQHVRRSIGAFTKELTQAFRKMGYAIRVVNKTIAEFLETQSTGRSDIRIGRWVADYPDADTFVHGILHSREGINGRYCGRARDRRPHGAGPRRDRPAHARRRSTGRSRKSSLARPS